MAKDFVQHDVDTTAMGGQVREAPGAASVYDPIRVVAVDEQLRTHGGVYFPYAAQIGQQPVFMTKGARAGWVAETFSPMLCEMEGGYMSGPQGGWQLYCAANAFAKGTTISLSFAIASP